MLKSSIKQTLMIGLVWFTSCSHRIRLNGPSTREELADLYPEQTPKFLEERIKAADAPFKFLRAFVPYYYRALKDKPADYPAFESLKSFEGWCAGDPHHENFGVMIDAESAAAFTLTDLDDSGPCPLVA